MEFILGEPDLTGEAFKIKSVSGGCEEGSHHVNHNSKKNFFLSCHIVSGAVSNPLATGNKKVTSAPHP